MTRKKKTEPGVVREVFAANIVSRMRARWAKLSSDEQRLVQISKHSGISVPTLRRIVRPNNPNNAYATSIVKAERIAMALRCETYELFLEPDEDVMAELNED